MKSIILLGYMCVGKTTIGRQLAREAGLSFYDLDWYIAERYRKSVADIFKDEGEEAFREKERRMLHEVAEFQDIVLATGGGTPCFYDNMDYMLSAGHTVYLKATPEVVVRHLDLSRGNRPLLQGMSREERNTFVARQLESRAPFYERAEWHIDVDVLAEQTAVARMAERIKALIPV